ncbi:DUF1656 domain-containing protein, partial [Pseudomonas aeruginosa]
MPRENAIQGVDRPALTLLFPIAAALTWGLARTFASCGLYRFTWSPALFRGRLFAWRHGGLSRT